MNFFSTLTGKGKAEYEEQIPISCPTRRPGDYRRCHMGAGTRPRRTLIAVPVTIAYRFLVSGASRAGSRQSDAGSDN
jgi:hypothetical protein